MVFHCYNWFHLHLSISCRILRKRYRLRQFKFWQYETSFPVIFPELEKVIWQHQRKKWMSHVTYWNYYDDMRDVCIPLLKITEFGTEQNRWGKWIINCNMKDFRKWLMQCKMKFQVSSFFGNIGKLLRLAINKVTNMAKTSYNTHIENKHIQHTMQE